METLSLKQPERDLLALTGQHARLIVIVNPSEIFVRYTQSLFNRGKNEEFILLQKERVDPYFKRYKTPVFYNVVSLNLT